MLISNPESSGTRNRTIKHNHLYLVDDVHGNIPCGNHAGMGLYNMDTRFLSGFEIKLQETDPIPLLSSTEMGYMSTIVFTNGLLHVTTADGLPAMARPETIQLKRETVLYGALFERYSLISYNAETIYVDVSFRLDADFKDMFDIRGIVNIPTGERHAPRWMEMNGRPHLVFNYSDATGRQLQTRISFKDMTPDVDIQGEHPVVTYRCLLKPRVPVSFNFEIQTTMDDRNVHTGQLETVVAGMDEALSHLNFRSHVNDYGLTRFWSDNEDFNEMILRNERDLRMLITHTDEGSYVGAGIPWYVALFGRDSIITSRFCLPVNPNIARDTLKILALYQGKELNPNRDEEPGKILHELRVGELARMGEIPHTPYYGSVDATPLWLILLYEYFQWTYDTETLCALWPHALAALEWIESNLERHPLGYSTYETCCERGILQQGWKDSHDSVMDEHGVVGIPPIALSEVQGYVYLARKRMGTLAEFLGDKALNQRLKKQNLAFKRRFNKDFWMPEYDYFALALDKDGKPFRVVGSNPGHCLETGIVDKDKAMHVINRLMSADMYSGWGIRTLSANAAAYNPMSYHNGSVWPHDNAMIAKGFAYYERSDLVEQVLTGLFEAARHMFYKRLPELFCGFRREEGKEGDPPVRYPVACSPQAWAAASMYSLLQSMLNLNVNAQKKILTIKSPRLPAWMNMLAVENMRIGQATVDLEFRRTDQTVMVNVKNRRGEINVVVEI